MTPKFYLPEVTNVNVENERDYSRIYEESCDEDIVL